MPSHFGSRLKQLRMMRGYTMEELGKKVGVAKTTISGYEHGKREPEIKVIHKLATTLDTTADYLLGLSQSIDRVTLPTLPGLSSPIGKLHWDGHVLTEEELESICSLLETIVQKRLDQQHTNILDEKAADT
ncbi:helix-turn-helix domain-containing protein [Paenibacillus cremeus]|uniref:Helix-turn-helix transcriptional regulator n=1 Tax=Paenibacillus cremeus TaxID=2163881 RepID=A0A559K7E9_9BACL|nr:helix-turn-helix transcriptional regulator [Paenibacillus cremeus]TVY08061.1 helix-turn-helix transcriptional regulator [Paenibacillus cremeus]